MARLGAFVCAALVALSVVEATYAVDRLVPSQYATIQAAINAASTGDRVLVAPKAQGYSEQLSLQNKAITLKSTNGPAVTELVGPAGMTGAVVSCVGAAPALCIIEGFVIRSSTNGPGVSITGGASPEFRNCEIKLNSHSAAGGGGVAFTGAGGSPKFVNCLFFANAANDRDGGAISATATGAASLTCENCSFLQNQSTGLQGGAIHTTVTTTLVSCVFRDNFVRQASGTRQGGAVNATAAVSAANCVFERNTVDCTYAGAANSNHFAMGGAISASNRLSLAGCNFSQNTAQCNEVPGATGFAHGGALYCSYAVSDPADRAIQLDACVFTGNIARNPLAQVTHGRQAHGGALYVVNGADPWITDCDFVNNTVSNTGYSSGGALWIGGGSNGQMLRCNIMSSTANSEGGAVRIDTSAAPIFESTVFANCSVAGGTGGAIRINAGAFPSFYDCRFTQCSAGTAGSGGAVWIDSARPVFNRCQFDRNTAGAASSAANGRAIRTQGSGILNIPSIAFSQFCGSGVASADYISGASTPAFIDPNATPSNVYLSACVLDCNGNGIDDVVDILNGTAADCDGNTVPDICQPDCDSDGIPNVCEITSGASDCDADALPDACEIASNPALDGNLDGVLDTCQSDFIGLVSEIVPITGTGTGLPTGAVCWRVYARFSSPDARLLGVYGDSVDTLSITATGGFWQSTAKAAGDLPLGIPCTDTPADVRYDSYLTVGAECGDGTPVAAQGIDFSAFEAGSVGLVSQSNGGSVYAVANGVAAGADGRVLIMQLTTKTGVKPVGQFNLFGEASIPSGGAEWHAMRLSIPDPELVDCNGNSQHDALEIAAGTITDCDLNGVPDACQSATATVDCDTDGTSDFCEFAAGSADSNNNGKPDECDCVADANGDGAVNVDDLIDVIVAWGDLVSGGPNVDGIGVVDSNDLTLVLSNWGSCVPLAPPGAG